MLATALQFGFLLLVALGNLCLGFALARRLGWGSSLPFAVLPFAAQSVPLPRDAELPALDAQTIGAGHTETDCPREPANSEPSGTASLDEAVDQKGDSPNSPDASSGSRQRVGEAVLAVLEESRETLVKIVAGLLEAGEALSPSELEAAALQTRDVGQQLQQRLNSAADQLRHGDRQDDPQAADGDIAELLERLQESINDALLGLLVLGFDRESLAEAILKLTETIQTIDKACQDAAARLEESLGEPARSAIVP